MRASFVAAAVLALGATAMPAPDATSSAPCSTETNSGEGWTQPWGYTWETRTWGGVTWTQPAFVTSTSGTPPPPPSTPAVPPPPATTCPSATTITTTTITTTTATITIIPTTTSYPTTTTGCLSDAEATQVANNFRDSIALPFNTTAISAEFATTFMDYSDSVIEVINSGCPNKIIDLGTATFGSLAEFIAGQSSQPPIPFEILNMWYNCNTVIIRWVSSPGPGGPTVPQQQVQGIIALETTPNPVADSSEPFLIQTVYSEFNSGAWLVDLGIFVPTDCTA